MKSARQKSRDARLQIALSIRDRTTKSNERTCGNCCHTISLWSDLAEEFYPLPESSIKWAIVTALMLFSVAVGVMDHLWEREPLELATDGEALVRTWHGAKIQRRRWFWRGCGKILKVPLGVMPSWEWAPLKTIVTKHIVALLFTITCHTHGIMNILSHWWLMLATCSLVQCTVSSRTCRGHAVSKFIDIPEHLKATLPETSMCTQHVDTELCNIDIAWVINSRFC